MMLIAYGDIMRRAVEHADTVSPCETLRQGATPEEFLFYMEKNGAALHAWTEAFEAESARLRKEAGLMAPFADTTKPELDAMDQELRAES